MYSLLDDELISVQLREGRALCSLPALLAHLAQDTVVELPGLQAHQEHPFYALLVQLGAMALHREGLDKAPTEAADWRPLLLDLSDGEESAWALVEADLSKPAFLQPPIPEGNLAVLKNKLDTPDTLDLLVTAKNHDLKAARAVQATPERWLYALVSCQTMQGFSGRDNYGVARMNSGFGNRPVVALLPDVSWGARFQADLAWLPDGSAVLGVVDDDRSSWLARVSVAGGRLA